MTRSLVTANSGTPTECQHIFSSGCLDRTGIIPILSTFLSDIGARITEADSLSGLETRWFFICQAVRADALDLTVEELHEKFAELVGDWGLEVRWKVTDNAAPKCAVILVTREGHCLQDLFGRVAQSNHLMEIAAVIGNHRDLELLVAAYDIPFHHVSFPKNAVGKRKAFDKVDEIVDTENPDAIVFVRFMQIPPPDLCEKWEGRAINIHHSFLPSLMGARPYLQAYRRGVKLIGVICHYAIEDLDDGSTIEQDVMRVSHKYTAADIQREGRDTERQVLAHGSHWRLEDRVQVYDNRTVVLQ